MFLLWTSATAVTISLPPLPACKGHVPEINPEPPWLGIPAGTDVQPKPGMLGVRSQCWRAPGQECACHTERPL